MCLFSESCRAPVMGNGYCYQHNPEISYEEKQRQRSLGGRSSKKVEVWQIPPESVNEISEIETLVDCKRALNSLYRWVLLGYLSPSQGVACKQILEGIKTAILDEETLTLLGYREKLKSVLGSNGHELQSNIVIDNGD